MTHARLIILATLGSAGLLAVAFLFQMLGYAPCKMCIWQRYPHVIAIAIGAAALLLKQSWMAALGAIATLTTAGIGFYHVGVEQDWWQGPTTCSSGSIDNLSPDALLDQIMNAPLVRCDDIPWELFGVSMAGWNALLSFALMGVWIFAMRLR